MKFYIVCFGEYQAYIYSTQHDAVDTSVHICFKLSILCKKIHSCALRLLYVKPDTLLNNNLQLCPCWILKMGAHNALILLLYGYQIIASLIFNDAIHEHSSLRLPTYNIVIRVVKLGCYSNAILLYQISVCYHRQCQDKNR